MPRLQPRLLQQAYAIDVSVARLLLVCRDLSSAQRELRWIREHARKVSKASSLNNAHRLVRHYVCRRSRGEPLQYILGSEFFGDLEINCRPGVLIPRQETAASVTHLVHLLSRTVESLPPDLRVLDLCTGSACIPLLFHHEFYNNDVNQNKTNVSLQLTGIDISSEALSLARENQALLLDTLDSRNASQCLPYQSLTKMTFLQSDVLHGSSVLQALKSRTTNAENPSVDILISNPPYISRSSYWRSTSSSVRNFEPRLALVPPTPENGHIQNDGDVFYHHILHIAQQLDAQIVLVEVADLDQAKRVASLAVKQGIWDGVEIWRDDPTERNDGRMENLEVKAELADSDIPILESGNGRSVLAYRGRGTQWLGKI